MRDLHRELLLVGSPLLVLLVLFGAGSVWSHRKGERQQRTCLSNLKNLNLAILQYSSDYDDVFPVVAPEWGIVDSIWTEKVDNDYEDEFFVCPTDSAPFDLRDKRLYNFRAAPSTSYVWNNAYAASGDGLSSPSGQARSLVATPQQTIMLADGTGDFLFRWELKDGISLPSEGTHFRLGSIVGRHNGRPNVLFCDGHVAAQPIEKIFLPRTHNGKSYFGGLSIEDD